MHASLHLSILNFLKTNFHFICMYVFQKTVFFINLPDIKMLLSVFRTLGTTAGMAGLEHVVLQASHVSLLNLFPEP